MRLLGVVKRQKIFAIGYNKTGTSSLHYLFNSLGFISYHCTDWADCSNLNLLKSYDCFSDRKKIDLPKLDTLFPGSKYILQVRDLESWVYSRLAHIGRNKKSNTAKTTSEWDNTEYAVKDWIKGRNEYHLFVLSYFSKRPEDFLIVNYVRDQAAAEKVANFLGFKGIFRKPKRNRNPEKNIPSRHREMLKNCINELGVPESELLYDIYCPSLEAERSYLIFPADTSMIKS